MFSIHEKVYSIVFLHIPKTAGTSFTSFLIEHLKLNPEEVYNVGQRGKTHIQGNINFINLNEEEKERYKLICGHVEYLLLNNIEYNIFSLTLLRNPIDRIVSIYYYILNNNKHHLHRIVKKNNMSIPMVMKSGLWVELNNEMVRRLIGALNVPYGRCNYKMLDMAKHNLKNKIDLFGFQNRFDEFINIFSQIFKINKLTYKFLNKTPNRKAIKELDEESIESIKRYNPLDIELYNYALELYEKKFSIYIK